MIASGTPREVALLEFVPSAKYMKKTGAASEDKPESKGKEEKKLSPSETSKAKLDAARKKIADARKLEMMRRNKNVIRNYKSLKALPIANCPPPSPHFMRRIQGRVGYPAPPKVFGEPVVDFSRNLCKSGIK